MANVWPSPLDHHGEYPLDQRLGLGDIAHGSLARKVRAIEERTKRMVRRMLQAVGRQLVKGLTAMGCGIAPCPIPLDDDEDYD